MYTFTAIDFETANANPNSICQIGLVKIKDGLIANEVSILVQPPRNHYWSSFIKIHGITPTMTALSPAFDEAWPMIHSFIEGQNIVAHNMSFDNNCLKHSLAHYHIAQPNYKTYCTYKIYKKGLAKICAELKIELKHHDALSDAKACAELFLKHLTTSSNLI